MGAIGSAICRYTAMLCLMLFVIYVVHLTEQLVAADVGKVKEADLGMMNPHYSESRLLPAFLSSLSITLVSEFGDKTFFIAAILAMKSSRLRVFLGCLVALFSMTLLSVGLGSVVHLVPAIYTHYLSIGLFMLLGSKMLYEGYNMKPDEGLHEYRAVEKTLLSEKNSPSEKDDQPTVNTFWRGAFWEALVMTFVAEWGDRSQISTIILAARDNAYMVTSGTILGHSICTGVAVLTGSFVAERVSVKSVVYIGGLVFLVFGVVGANVGYTDAPAL